MGDENQFSLKKAAFGTKHVAWNKKYPNVIGEKN